MIPHFRLPGRPKLEVPIEEIEYLRELQFSWTKIASILEISRSTLYRRLAQEGIDLACTFSNISDSALDGVMNSIKQAHPNDGERLVIGHLRCLGYRLPRSRIRASIHRIDPVNTALRRSVTVRRRVYSVPGPNALWHMDGHHKLIKWRFITHGAIDGYSRTVVYLRCSTNNRSSTVKDAFLDAVSKYGIPDKIRSDLGGENVRVWQYMSEQHQHDAVVLVGSSTHNQRIERLWRDVHRCVSVLYADLFRRMEDEGNLDCLNEVDMFCLHEVYLPRINKALDAFVECWNNHPVSTEENLTPNQLFIQGALAQNMTPMLHNPSPHATVTPTPTIGGIVNVPESNFLPCPNLQRDLEQLNLPTVTSDFSFSVYQTVCRFVGMHLHHCNDCS